MIRYHMTGNSHEGDSQQGPGSRPAGEGPAGRDRQAGTRPAPGRGGTRQPTGRDHRQGPGQKDRPAFTQKRYFLPGNLNRLDLDRDRWRRLNRLVGSRFPGRRIKDDGKPLVSLIRLAHP